MYAALLGKDVFGSETKTDGSVVPVDVRVVDLEGHVDHAQQFTTAGRAGNQQ